ncbi:MAG: pyridoxal phosphate-dependent aminotransferase [Gemmatimonadota bacterium]|nr:pyridoxal phosphate-dependent aminotransferase [Gemmatimonadota bacterium]
MNLARRMDNLGTESAFEVLVKARELEARGRDVVHLEIGEPDFDTPAHIVNAAREALQSGYTHYGPPVGLPELREAIARDVSRFRGIQVNPDQVVVTPGAKPIMFYAILALAQPGDEVIYPDPGFPIYESVIRFAGARPVPVSLTEERDFSLDVNELADLITDRTRLLIINSPQNPTSGIIPPADLKAIAELAVDRGIPVLADEIYSRIRYDDAFHSISVYDGMRDLTIILDGFSKTYAMTGWRIGYGVMPENLAETFGLLMVNSNSCTATFTQRAALAALQGPQDDVGAMVAEFRRRRDIFVAGLREIPGIRCRLPGGAFYLFPNIEGLGLSSQEVADYLLYEGNVAALSGHGFGAFGEGHVRFSFANSVENIRKALDRIADCVRKIRG